MHGSGVNGSFLMLARTVPLILLILAVPFIYANVYETSKAAQTLFNLGVMHSDNLIQGLSNYPKVWPPLYPALLWVVHQTAGLTAFSVNASIFCMALIILTVFCNKHCEPRYAFVPIGLLAINNVFFYNASFATSEMLMLAEAALLMLLMARYLEAPTPGMAFLLGLLTALACWTRYFGLLWLFPTSVVCLLLANTAIRAKLTHLVMYGATSFVFSTIWIAYVYATTGYLTGMSRTGTRPDESVGKFRAFVEQTGFEQNITGTVKTATYDLLSHNGVGNYKVLMFEEFSSYEKFLALVLLLSFSVVVAYLARLVRAGSVFREFGPGHLPAVFGISYVLLTILIWTSGNNDPIFTRFLYPSYPFLVVAGYIAYVSSKGQSSWHKLSRVGLLLFLLLALGNQALETYSLLAPGAS